jgi:DNA modification methylase
VKIAFQNENVTLWHGDCREWSGKADAVVSDPPYGMNLDTDFSGMSGHKYDPIVGDDKPFDPAPWLDFPSVVFWGAQYFCHRLPEVGGWLVFNKRGDGKPSEICFGDCELAWCSVGQAVRMFSRMWHGVARWSSEGRLHPTQKPVDLMAWCMDRAKVPTGSMVLDPYAGSGTTLIAALETGRKAIGIEIDERWVEVARRRLERWHAQGRLEFGTANPEETRP